MSAERGDEPWGSVLDAGTGGQSLAWLLEQETLSWTAITGSRELLDGLRDQFGARMRRQDRLVEGRWSDPHLLSGEVHDRVIAHYLLGAVERLDPHFQHRLFRRLRPLVGRRLYVIGLEPLQEPGTDAEVAARDVIHFRDACLLHAGERPFREYPLWWVLDNLRDSGFEVIETRCFASLLSVGFVNRVVGAALQGLGGLRDQELAAGLRGHGEGVRDRALRVAARGPQRWGTDYLIIARPHGRSAASLEEPPVPVT